MKFVSFALSFLLSVGLCCKALADEEVQPSQEQGQQAEGATQSNASTATSAETSTSGGDKSEKSATKKKDKKKSLKLFHKKAKPEQGNTK